MVTPVERGEVYPCCCLSGAQRLICLHCDGVYLENGLNGDQRDDGTHINASQNVLRATILRIMSERWKRKIYTTFIS